MKKPLFLLVASVLLSITVNAQQKSNAPLGGGSILLRGTGVPVKVPLVILDGKIIDNEFNELDPNQISSFRILKDASAVALYGKEAENGVIIITSKKPLETLNVTSGDKASVILRGNGIMGKTPLYVVDGNILEAGHIAGLDPNKIDSLQILKSVSAVAEYGPAAVNGVVVIKTKKDTPQQIKK